MKINRPSQVSASDEDLNAEQIERKKRPPKLTVELDDDEVEMLAYYIAEHRTTQREVVRWLIRQLPHLPGGPPLRSQSRPARLQRKARGGTD